MGKMKNVGYSDLKKSRDKHEKAARSIEDDNARRMLLFYSVECGAKYQYMKDNGYKLYNNVPDKYRNNMHDIKELLKNIGICGKCKFPTVISKYGDEISSGAYQEMWRYGIAIRTEDRDKINLIEENMNMALELLHDIERRR